MPYHEKYWVYILCSGRNGTLYVGVTNDLIRRVYQHKNGIMGGFTKKYNVHKLVFIEEYSEIVEAIAREKQIKKWERNWKLRLIEEFNPEWRDYYENV